MVLGMETQVPIGEPLRSSTGLSHGSSSNLELHSHGDENTTEYRVKATDKSGAKTISLWHDVTLVHVDPATDRPTPYLNFVCEIPKFSRYVSSVYCVVMSDHRTMVQYYNELTNLPFSHLTSFYINTEKSTKLQLMKWVTLSSRMRRRVSCVRLVYTHNMSIFAFLESFISLTLFYINL